MNAESSAPTSGTLRTAGEIALAQAAAPKPGAAPAQAATGKAAASPTAPAPVAPSAAAAKAAPVTGNRLGTLAGGPPPPPAQIDMAKLVRRHFAGILPAPALPALRETGRALAKEQALIEEHSPVIQQDRVRQAAATYAQDPSPANLKALRELKTLTFEDHALVQQHARTRRQIIFKEKIAPLEREAYTRFADLVEEDVRRLQAEREANYAEFGCAAPPDSLIVALERIVANYRRMAEHAAKGVALMDDMPELFAEILKVADEAAEKK